MQKVKPQDLIQFMKNTKKAPEVTRQRMYLETIERVYGGMDKIIIDQDGEGNNSGVVPYLPLDQLQKRQDSGENQ
jgi:membrane protease subunit HflK